MNFPASGRGVSWGIIFFSPQVAGNLVQRD